MIATRLHTLIEIAGHEGVIARSIDLPHYVIDDALMGALARDDMQKSVLAMIEAGIAHLPFSPMLVEFSVAAGCCRFVRLEEGESVIRVEGASLYRDQLVDVSATVGRVTLEKTGLSVDRSSNEAEGLTFALAVMIALLMLNIRGVDKTFIEPSRLNKARRDRGRTVIRSHTIVRIGTVYDRSGAFVAGGAKRSMPVHLRAGHTRMQACGPEHSERRPVYIPPVLVNFRDGSEAPKAPRKVVSL